MNHLSPTEAAYLAGFLDGEGWFGVTRRKRTWADGTGIYLRPVVAVGQKRREPIDWIVERTGVAVVEHRHNEYGPHYLLKFHTGTLRWLLPEIMPYLVLKCRQAELVMQFICECKYQGKKLTGEQLAHRESIRAELEILNARGKKTGEPPNEAYLDRLRRKADQYLNHGSLH